MTLGKEKIIKSLLFFAVFANVLFWFYARDIRQTWEAVPPVPSKLGASAMTLGDEQFASRIIGIMLQNFGDTGGRTTALRDYDFEELSKWLYLNTELDPRSGFTPFLAAMYYGAVDDTSKLPPLLAYLSDVGKQRTELKNNKKNENWRWLAHAAYLARFQLKDLDLALKYAQQLAALPGDQPAWTRQMPGFIQQAKGNKEEALAVMLEILKSGVDTMHPNEINHTRSVICERILDPDEAAVHPLCEGDF